MKKGFALSIVLWISLIFIAISIYFLQISKDYVKFSYQINDKLIAFLKAKSTLEKLKFYLATGHYLYNRVFNNVKGLNKSLRVDNYIYDINNTIFSLQDISGIYRLWGLDSTFKNFLIENNINRKTAEIMYNSYLDWIDKDNVSRNDGAEINYYLSKKFDYFPRNGNIPLVYEVLDIRGWKKNFNRIQSLLVLGNLGISNNFTVMPFTILKSRYGLSDNDIKFLMKLKKNDNMKGFINYFYEIPKKNFDFETDSYFNSKIVIINIKSNYKGAVYKIYEIINFNNNIVEFVNF